MCVPFSDHNYTVYIVIVTHKYTYRSCLWWFHMPFCNDNIRLFLRFQTDHVQNFESKYKRINTAILIIRKNLQWIVGNAVERPADFRMLTQTNSSRTRLVSDLNMRHTDSHVQCLIRIRKCLTLVIIFF